MIIPFSIHIPVRSENPFIPQFLQSLLKLRILGVKRIETTAPFAAPQIIRNLLVEIVEEGGLRAVMEREEGSVN